MKTIILAGGKGTRLKPYTTILPKPLMPIGDSMAIIEIILCQLSYYGLTDISLAVGHLSELIMSFCSDGKRFGTNINYSFEDKPLGTAGPISLIDGLIEPFLVMNGDILTSLNFKDLISFHKSGGNIATIVTFNRDETIEFGVIEKDSNNKVIKYIEKPINNYNVSTGIYIFEPEVMKFITKGTYLNLPDLIKLLIDNKQDIGCYDLQGRWLDIGRKDDYEEAGKVFELFRQEFLPNKNKK